MSRPEEPLDLGAVRRRLAAARGPEYWRTLEELADTPAFRELLQREAPQHARELAAEGLDRRKFLGLLGASLALAGLSGCAQAPVEHIVPYVRQPEGVVPGRPTHYATAMPLAGYANGGLLVLSHLGRPTKVEGNPDHPWSPRPANSPEHARLGPSDLFAQASILGLYDPDRSQTVRYRYRETSSWENFRSALAAARQRLRGRGGDPPRLRVLTGTTTSPTLLAQLRAALPGFPRGWHRYEPTHSSAAHQGARLAFDLPAGRSISTHYRVDRSRRIVALDSDFLACGPGHLRYARDFAAGRVVREGQDHTNMNRLYAVESTMTVTGARADHRVALPSWQVERFALALARQLGAAVGEAPGDEAFGVPAGWLRALAQDLQDHPGRSLVVPGEGQTAALHALAHAMNERLGGVGQTVFYTEPVDPGHGAGTLEDLIDAIDHGDVEVLVILGGNPVYNAPANLGLASTARDAPLERVGLRVHLSPYFDETSVRCHWHVPEAHYLESWGDVRAADGTVSLVQPLIAPLYRGRTASEVMAVLTGQPEQSAYEILRAHWRRAFEGAEGSAEELRGYARFGRGGERSPGDFEPWWRRSLRDGFVEGTEAPPARALAVRRDLADALSPALHRADDDAVEVVFRPDPAVFDGSFANNGWLQELPRPLSHLTWGNAAFLSAALAARLGLCRSAEPGQAAEANGKEVVLRLGRRHVAAPVWVLPGHADNSVTVHLGQGRTRAGRVGDGVGFSAYELRDTAHEPGFTTGLRVEPTGGRVVLASVHNHHHMHGRDLVRSGSIHHYEEAVREAAPDRDPRRTVSLYPDYPYGEGHQWGMAIDLGLCTGCQACVVACQSENNIPVVGKEQVLRGREMHWLRIDTYYKGPLDDPRRLEAYSQPVPCMHCENAPCELVCPVDATVHSDDGLNDMVYNRCVGTRYCSNNCPYKVRRFNFLQYADFDTEVLRLGRNPEVTVRSRGVMEKCTYCVQRIRQGEIEATVAGRELRDGDVQTACQAACPAGAIVFGDLNARDGRRRPLSLVGRLQAQPVNYGLLGDLNTRPRTTYLWSFRNPNPALAAVEPRARG